MVTGAAGFAGRYAVAALKRAGHATFASDMAEADGVTRLDIRSAAAVGAAVAAARPDACLHLAAVSFVPDAARDPDGLHAINVAGTLHLAEALRRHAPRARLLFVSSAQVYGAVRGAAPLSEDAVLRPASDYAKSKAAAEEHLLTLCRDGGLNVAIARPGNHTGPGQSPKFVVPAFIAAVRAFRDGRLPAIPVGNLECERDFTDVRDVTAAYLLLLERARTGAIYNIASGARLRIGELLERIARLAGVTPRIEVKPELYRPTDAAPVLSTASLVTDTGWQPRIGLDDTLRDMWAES
ncbi:MAG: GDP-mannose 4,6-dehydratase [Kiritimatiellae bacterium]|nr:GDP-mannose 4,6-dehydratase [Kiritimatiellia bacterium]